MCEITRLNFKAKLPEIENCLRKSKFISLDLEFSALYPLQTPRLFDSNKERYEKLRTNLKQVIPVQLGLTSFHFNNDTNDYFAHTYTFYLRPAVFASLNKSFCFQASTLQFLSLYNFDFNKFARLGISYINNEEEAKIEKILLNDGFCIDNGNLRADFQTITSNYLPIITKWYSSSKIGDFLDLPEILNKYSTFDEILYCLHIYLRSRFANLWTYEENSTFKIRKVTYEEFRELERNHNLVETTLDNLRGFQHVYRILKSLRKPIIGHNILQDLMIMLNNFDTPLPESYSKFKGLVRESFPAIFDTKTMFYELRPRIPKHKLPDDTSLRELFEYFKNGTGRHLVNDSTAIECNMEKMQIDCFHDAGWDSFCTGYIFLRMAYYNLACDYPKCKKFVSTELISGLTKYKNRVNVIRGATSHIKIDGEDPTSNRPPWLIVESVKNEPVDLRDLMSSLSSYGFVDIKRCSSNGRRVLVAVDNYRSAREITNRFQGNSKFQIKRYSVLKHSPVAQAIILSAITISGTLLIWLTHSAIKR